MGFGTVPLAAQVALQRLLGMLLRVATIERYLSLLNFSVMPFIDIQIFQNERISLDLLLFNFPKAWILLSFTVWK